MKLCNLFGLVVIYALSASGQAYAWEADTHYGLVKWLAVKGGFSLENAEIVAAGSESADESWVLSATEALVFTRCSVEASRHVQMHHFPAGGFVPSPPIDRPVVPGVHTNENSGNRWTRQEIDVKTDGIHTSTQLDRFGASLHPLADSWSHQGVSHPTDFTRWWCEDVRFWSHSFERGGWNSHNADLTHKYPKDAVAAAKTLYHYIRRFLEKNKDFKDHAAADWDSLKAEVSRFAKAEKANVKYEWFKDSYPEVWSSFTTYPCFLQDTNLAGSSRVPCSPNKKEKIADQPGVEAKYVDVPEGLAELIDKFLSKWIVERDVDNAVKDFVAVKAVTDQLVESIPSRFETERAVRLQFAEEQPSIWVKTLLTMWLASDHGLVNARGHGMPEHTGFENLVRGEFETIPVQQFETLADAIHVPGMGLPYLLLPVEQEDQRYAVLFQFRHTPRDTIILIAEPIDGEWKISGLFWMIM